MIETHTETGRNAATKTETDKTAVLKRLQNGETAAEISAETGILAATIRGWAFKEKNRLEVENATKRQFLMQNAETVNAKNAKRETVQNEAAIVSSVSANRATATMPSATLPDFQLPVSPENKTLFLQTQNAGDEKNETAQRESETAKRQNGETLRTFFSETWKDYVGEEVLLAFISFVGMGFSVYSWQNSFGDFGYGVAIMGNLWVLHSMKVSRDNGAWNSGNTSLMMAFIFEAVTVAVDMNLLYYLCPPWLVQMGENAAFWFALIFSSIALWFKFGAIYQAQNRTADAVQNA